METQQIWTQVAQSPYPVVCMCVYKDALIVATERRVYQLVDGVLEPIQFLAES